MHKLGSKHVGNKKIDQVVHCGSQKSFMPVYHVLVSYFRIFRRDEE